MIIQPQILTAQPDYQTPADGAWRVRVFDYDGALISTQYKDTSEDATVPVMPTHSELTLAGFNRSFANIQSDIDIGAIYTTTDEKTHAHVRLTTVSGLGLTLYLNKSDGSTLTVDWGDESSDDFTATGNFNTGSHTYSTIGDYTVKMWISSGTGTYGFGNSSPATSFCGGATQTDRNKLLKLFIGSSVIEIGNSSFYYHWSLSELLVPSTVGTIESYACETCHRLVSINIPSGMSIETLAFHHCYAMRTFCLPLGMTTYGFHNILWAIQSIVVPSDVTSLLEFAFYQCVGVIEYVFNSTTPPTLANINAFGDIRSSCKIYVPDASLATYKAATNWSTYADYIYAMSDRT